MLENFIYAKQKSLFERALNNGEVLDEAIVFIEDTKEIWNHGTYFDSGNFKWSIITAKLITFTINETEYQAEDGMTWEEWINDGNDLICKIANDGSVVYIVNAPLPLEDSSGNVYKDLLIKENGSYFASSELPMV